MALPKGDQYNEAVQNPRISFADPDLKSAKVETGMFDLPKPYSGGFTVTFKLQTTAANFAVRCFTRDITDIQKRYQAITNFFSTKSSRYFVEAKYLTDGIKVAGTFYPIIKMKWMDGEPLNIYLENNRTNKAKLQSLLVDFLNLVSELETLGIAHGDLQQGNIIVKNDRLFLIDYDGMYLPALNGLKSNELGHPNFQHPQRSAIHYNSKIDRFSAIVIYLSLKALIEKPTLWKYNNGENIILKSQDIADLKSSQVIADLNSITELKPLVERFVGICHLDFDKVPSLSEFIAGSFVYDKNNISKIAVKASQYEVLDAKMKGTLLEHYGEKVEVIGLITDNYRGSTSGNKPYYFLNFGRYPSQTFTITVWSTGISALSADGKSPSLLVGKWISVIGVITSYGGRPQVIVERSSQIHILNNEQEAKDRLRLKNIAPKPNPIVTQTTTKKPSNTEADIFDKLYKNIPVSKPQPTTTIKPPVQTSTPKPVQTPTPKPIQPKATTPKSTHTKTNSSKSDNNGCTGPIILLIIGAIIGAALSKNGDGVLPGIIIAGVLSYLIFYND